jgi:hypothetical protein
VLRQGGLLVAPAALLARGCSIDRVGWERAGFVPEGVTSTFEEEHHAVRPTTGCITRAVGGAVWERRARTAGASSPCNIDAGAREKINAVDREREEEGTGEE